MSGETSFSIDEIRDQLEKLGYKGVGDDRLYQFQKDLSHLMTSSDRSHLMTSSGLDETGDSTETSNQIKVFDLSTEMDESSTLLDGSDVTSYNPLPEIHVPRQVVINDSIQKSLDGLDGFLLADPPNLPINHFNQSDHDDDTDSVKTEDLLLYSKESKGRMRRKISKKNDFGDSYITVTDESSQSQSGLLNESSTNQSIISTSSIYSDLIGIDEELKQRLLRLKININNTANTLNNLNPHPLRDGTNRTKPQRRPVTAASTRNRQKVKFNEENLEIYEKRPTTAPARLNQGSQPAPAFLRPDLSIKQKSSPVDLYYKVSVYMTH
jgi:hypothetical protein